MPDFNPPPDTTSSDIPEAIAFNTAHNPDYPFFIYSNDNVADGYSTITHKHFGDVVHRIAYALRPDPTSTPNGVVALILHCDTITYHAVTVGCVIAGFIPMPISPRNSPPAVVNLLQQTNCHRIITHKEVLQPLMDAVLSHIAMHDPRFNVQIDEAPALLEVYPHLARHSGTSQPPESGIQYTRPESHDPLSICLYLHSSGSTGMPKPIPVSRKGLGYCTRASAVQKWTQADKLPIVATMPLPPFHSFGFLAQVVTPVWGGLVAAVYPPTVFRPGQSPIVPSPDNILNHIQGTRSREVFTVPAFLQLWAKSPEAVEILRSLDRVYYGGSPLPPTIGNFYAEKGVALTNLYGATEVPPTTSLSPRARGHDAWDYFAFDEVVNVRLDPQGDGTFEVQILNTEEFAPYVTNMPNNEGYATSDIVREHPTIKGLWRVVGRIDDLIIHTSGEKTVPVPLEAIIMSDPMIHGAVLFGQQRNHVGALIELKPGFQVDITDEARVNETKTKIWPIIEEANHAAPAFSRIYKETIIFSLASKPLPRAGKGSVMRKMALQLYESEINKMYDSIGNIAKGIPKVDPPASWDRPGLTAWFLKQLQNLHPDVPHSASVDLFDQGMDSLDVAFLRQRMLSILRQPTEGHFKTAAKEITDNVIYARPTVDALVSHVLSLLALEDGVHVGNDHQTIEDMITKHSHHLPPVPTSRSSLPGNLVVLLAGSTGNLGAHLLARFVRDDRVAKVYALNRKGSESRQVRHDRRFIEHGLEVELLGDGKVVYVESNLAQDHLELDAELYEELRTSVNVIVHSAWRLNFNLSLSSYERNIRGTRNLIDLALTSTHSTSLQFIFTSSIGSAQSWDKSKGVFPEALVLDADVAVGPGYGEAKYICERLLLKSGLQFCSLRLGQLAGDRPNGAWATTDWVPIMVKSSIHLSALPLCPGVVSWLPVGVVASTVHDLLWSAKGASLPQAINVAHPRPIYWNDVIALFNQVLVELGIVEGHMQTIPIQEWVKRLEEHSVTPTDEVFEAIPAIKLRDHFATLANATYIDPTKEESGGLAQFEMKKSRKMSPALDRLASLQKDDVELWVKFWDSVGYFKASGGRQKHL